jgi:hypothetical protein
VIRGFKGKSLQAATFLFCSASTGKL